MIVALSLMGTGRYGKTLWNPGKDPASGKGRLCYLGTSFNQHLQCRYITFEPEKAPRICDTGVGLYDKTD